MDQTVLWHEGHRRRQLLWIWWDPGLLLERDTSLKDRFLLNAHVHLIWLSNVCLMFVFVYNVVGHLPPLLSSWYKTAGSLYFSKSKLERWRVKIKKKSGALSKLYTGICCADSSLDNFAAVSDYTLLVQYPDTIAFSTMSRLSIPCCFKYNGPHIMTCQVTYSN